MDKESKAIGQGDQLEMILESWLPPVKPEASRYPALFTRIPLFAPIKDRDRANSFDPDAPVSYDAGAVQIRRIGKGLSVYDEDTLIAILQLASEKSIKGEARAISRRLPPAPDPDGSGQGEIGVEGWAVEEVWIGNATPYKINEFLERGTGGGQLKQCQASVKRLSQTILIVSNPTLGRERTMVFFELVNDHSEKGKAYVKIGAAMVNLLRHYATIDVSVRKSLNDVGKALHRFLSGVDMEFVFTFEELQAFIGYAGSASDFKRALAGRKATAKVLICI